MNDSGNQIEVKWLVAERSNPAPFLTARLMRVCERIALTSCRVHNTKCLLIVGMIRRLVISPYMYWRGRQPRPRHLSLTDPQAAMGEDDLAKAFAFVPTSTLNSPDRLMHTRCGLVGVGERGWR